MVAVDAQLRQIGAQGLVELQYRLAETVVRDADALEADGVAHAAADRLGERLLGGEALRQEPGRIGVSAKLRQLALAQQPFGEALAVTRPQCLEAGVFDDVRADTENHRHSRACGNPVIKRPFIFRTAASSPMNSDSAMIAWPMLSSTMLGI